MDSKQEECGCHRYCTTEPHWCAQPCGWPNCLTEDEHARLLAELSEDDF